ncbi:MAG: hypothetical protein RJA70_1715 [Pseudomonadota bacterium]|jgi:hypothetical protein
MANVKTSRRHFMAAAGASSLVLPVFEAFTPQKAQAQMFENARQLITYYTANGVPGQENFFPRGGTPTNFTLGPILSPLEPHKQDLLIVEGLDSRAAMDAGGDPHGVGFATTLSGRKAVPGGEFKHGACFNDMSGKPCPSTGLGGGPSLDIEVGQAHVAAKVVPIGSLNYSVKTAQKPDLYTYLSYSAPGVPVNPESDPLRAFNRVFKALGGDPTVSDAQAARLKARGKSVLDELGGEFDLLMTQVSQTDRARLQQHQDAMRNLEKKVDLLTTVVVGGSCKVPIAPQDLGPGPAVVRNAGGMEDKNAAGDHGDIELRQDIYRGMIIAALACGLTRVGTLATSFSRADTYLSFLPYNGLPIQSAHHAMSHGEGENPNEKLIVVNNWYALKFGQFIDQLKSTMGPTGEPLFKTAGIFWCNELATGGHTHNNKPHLVAGTMGGYLKNGLHHTYPKGTPHNVLLTALAKGAGLATDHIGDTEYQGQDLTPLLA